MFHGLVLPTTPLLILLLTTLQERKHVSGYSSIAAAPRGQSKSRPNRKQPTLTRRKQTNLQHIITTTIATSSVTRTMSVTITGQSRQVVKCQSLKSPSGVIINPCQGNLQNAIYLDPYFNTLVIVPFLVFL